MPAFTCKFTVGTKAISLNCAINDLGSNCGLAQLSNFTMSLGNAGMTLEGWQEIVDSKEFDAALVDIHGRYEAGKRPKNFNYSAYVLATNMCCLEYSIGGNLTSINTATFIALLMRSKKGAIVATPLYDNRAHGIIDNNGDSLQTCVTWWPESCVGSILSTDVYSRFPKHIFMEAERKWKWCKEFRSRVQFIYDSLKWTFSNPIPKPEAKPKNATPAATTVVWDKL
jgi:hypothetical protein